MQYTETKSTYIDSVKVTSQTYDLYHDALHYSDGTIIDLYILRSTKGPKRYWRAVPAGKPGLYYFSTIKGTPIRRGGNKVLFFIAGDTITHIK